jgi:4'-phosphopantetheinyl transferase
MAGIISNSQRMPQDTSHLTWSRPLDNLDLQPHQVDVWRVSLDLPTASVKLIESVLSADESQRAARFHFPADRDRFIVAHGRLRRILTRYLHCEPHQLVFSTGQYGKPGLISHEGIDFNLAHSGDYAVVAVTRGRKVGVDVERFRHDMELESIARRFFSQGEVSELLALPPEQREAAFFNGWTRKEAYIKAHGLGLSLPLDSFDVSLAPNKPAVLRATRPNPREAARWTFESLEVDSGYASAVAVEGQGLEFRLWDWNHHS